MTIGQAIERLQQLAEASPRGMNTPIATERLRMCIQRGFQEIHGFELTNVIPSYRADRWIQESEDNTEEIVAIT